MVLAFCIGVRCNCQGLDWTEMKYFYAFSRIINRVRLMGSSFKTLRCTLSVQFLMSGRTQLNTGFRLPMRKES